MWFCLNSEPALLSRDPCKLLCNLDCTSWPLGHRLRIGTGPRRSVKLNYSMYIYCMYSERYLDFPCNAKSLTRPALQSPIIFIVTHTLFRRLYVSLHLTATLLSKTVEAFLQCPNSMSPEKLGTYLPGYSALAEHGDIRFCPGQSVVHFCRWLCGLSRVQIGRSLLHVGGHGRFKCMKSLQVCSSRSSRLPGESRSEARSSMNHCAPSFSVHSLQNPGQKVRPVHQESVHDMQTRHSHQFENCNIGKMFGKSW
jgi:hypothetical protein